MRLELATVPVDSVALGGETSLEGLRLTIAAEQFCNLVAADRRLQEVRLEISNPGDDCRVVDVFDVFEPRFKPDGVTFPGVVEAVGSVGSGRTVAARGVAVVVLNGIADRFNSTIDMCGPGARLSPYSRTANICLRSRPAPEASRAQYYRALKEAGVKLATAVGNAVAYGEGFSRQVFELGTGPTRRLPRIAYIYMLASQQVPTEVDEPILYGDNVRALLPTVLHPNEILDSAVVAPYWNFGGETYSIQNHPMVLELYRRDGVELEFAGVIAMVAADTETARQRSALMAANLARFTLGADGVILTKYGGGIPEAAVMETYDACEALGMKGTIAIWTHRADGRTESSLTIMSPTADAVVSCGMYDDFIELPRLSRVIGSDNIGPLIVEAENEIRPSAGPLRLRYAHITGAIDQLGGSRLSIEEF